MLLSTADSKLKHNKTSQFYKLILKAASLCRQQTQNTNWSYTMTNDKTKTLERRTTFRWTHEQLWNSSRWKDKTSPL